MRYNTLVRTGFRERRQEALGLRLADEGGQIGHGLWPRQSAEQEDNVLFRAGGREMTYHIEIVDGESVGYKYHHICKKCGRAYEVIEYEQTPGFRDMEDETCPHCGHV